MQAYYLIEIKNYSLSDSVSAAASAASSVVVSAASSTVASGCFAV